MDKMGDTNGIAPGGIIYTGTRDQLQQKLRARDDRITELEAAIREMQRSVPGGEIASCQEIADELRAIAQRHGVLMGDEAI